MKKIRLLIVPSDSFGVGHYRSIWPAQEIQKNHSEDFEVDIRLQQPITEDDLTKFDIVHFHRRLNGPNETIEWIKKFQDAGVIVVSDIDDYWMPFHGHPARDIAIKHGLPQQILSANKESDYITTTTELYKKHLAKNCHDRIHIIPNAVDINLKMWSSEPQSSDKVRVAWIGGSSHMRDLERLKGTFNKLFTDPEVCDRIQVVMCGYDTRGTVTEFNPVTKKETVRPIRPEESIWNKFEEIFNKP